VTEGDLGEAYRGVCAAGIYAAAWVIGRELSGRVRNSMPTPVAAALLKEAHRKVPHLEIVDSFSWSSN
jgi:hypothetical protein